MLGLGSDSFNSNTTTTTTTTEMRFILQQQRAKTLTHPNTHTYRTPSIPGGGGVVVMEKYDRSQICSFCSAQTSVFRLVIISSSFDATMK